MPKSKKSKLSQLNSFLLFANIILLQIYLFRFSVFNIPTNAQEILIGLNAVVFLALIIKEKRLIETIKNLKKYWIIISLATLSIISVITILPVFTGEPIPNSLDLIRHGKFIFFAIILSLIFLETLKTENSRAAGIEFMAMGAALFGLFSLEHNLSGNNITHDHRLLGPLDSAVYLAYYLSPFFIYYTIKFIEKPKKENLIYTIIVLFLILGTKSMGAIGANFVVITIYLLKRYRNIISEKSELYKILSSKITKISFILVGILIIGSIFYIKILPSFQTQYTSLNERTEIWKTSIHLLSEPKNAILGVGIGQFQEVYAQNVDSVLGHKPLDYAVLQPHNIFLLFIFQYGILGLAFLIFYIIKLVQLLLKPIKRKPDIYEISLFMILYFFIHGLIDTPIFKNDLMILFILLLQLSLFSNRSPNPSKQHKGH